MYLCSSLLKCKYFLVGTTVRNGVRVEIGVEIHVVSLCAETPGCELQRGQQVIFFIVTILVTYEFIYCWYNSLFKQVVSGDRRARAVALEKS